MWKVRGRSALTKHPAFPRLPPPEPRLPIPARACLCPVLESSPSGRCRCLVLPSTPNEPAESCFTNVKRCRLCTTGYIVSVVPTHIRVVVRGVTGRGARSEASCGDEIAIRRAEDSRSRPRRKTWDWHFDSSESTCLDPLPWRTSRQPAERRPCCYPEYRPAIVCGLKEGAYLSSPCVPYQ